MQPVQINPQGTNAAEPHRPMLHPLHGQNVDLANESGLGVGDLARAARNLWSLCKRSLPWLMGAFGVYQIWRLFEDRADHAPAKSPEEAAVVPAGGRPARRPPSPSPAISGPIAGLRAAALGVVGAAVAAIEDPEKRKPSDPFALRLLRTVTRFAGPGANTGLALEEAAPDVICGTRLLSRGDAVHAGGAFARAFVKTAMTMAAGRAGRPRANGPSGGFPPEGPSAAGWGGSWDRRSASGSAPPLWPGCKRSRPR
ncbi:protein of unknown function [Methylacidimicrobium sp. AP8]|uniref:hypothetical protein n=1 Tax=Methylacidimicrobium sp. AP8 TaxID=2730359 RepID=UPI0018C0F8D4|nr:hypothetical protein [Methylacidimicrobium sp. AP8]CAB4243571.1 protein of unknown function [Methylacidimicrobium sp. AP8]